MAKKSSTRGHLWFITAAFVISQGGKRSLCMADEGEEEVVSVEVHVDGMTVRGAARREAVEEARRMAENDVNVEEDYDAIWNIIENHAAQLNVMQNELMDLLPPKRRLMHSAAAKTTVIATGATATVYHSKRDGHTDKYFNTPQDLEEGSNSEPTGQTALCNIKKCQVNIQTTFDALWKEKGKAEDVPVPAGSKARYSKYEKEEYVAECPNECTCKQLSCRYPSSW